MLMEFIFIWWYIEKEKIITEGDTIPLQLTNTVLVSIILIKLTIEFCDCEIDYEPGQKQ